MTIDTPRNKPGRRSSNPSSRNGLATVLVSCCLLLILGMCNPSVVVVTGFTTTTTTSRTRRTPTSLLRLVPTTTPGPPPDFSPQPRRLSSTASRIEKYSILESSSSRFGGLSTELLAEAAASSSQTTSSSENGLVVVGTNKRNFFASLDSLETLNGATPDRSALLAKMINEKQVVAVAAGGEKKKATEETPLPPATTVTPTRSYENPGSARTFMASSSGAKTSAVAEGTWKVVYAPHMTTASDLFRGTFDVTYDLFSDGRIVSHAFYDFPVFGRGYLSVSGTYGSAANDPTNTYSRVDFDRAWIKALPSSTPKTEARPYESLDAVPDSFLKTAINEIGKRAFIESVAVFPVSFLDDDTVVFEFEFLGTKICAHKQV